MISRSRKSNFFRITEDFRGGVPRRSQPDVPTAGAHLWLSHPCIHTRNLLEKIYRSSELTEAKEKKRRREDEGESRQEEKGSSEPEEGTIKRRTTPRITIFVRSLIYTEFLYVTKSFV